MPRICHFYENMRCSCDSSQCMRIWDVPVWYIQHSVGEYEMSPSPIPTPELTAVSAVRRSGDCISPASSLVRVPPRPSCRTQRFTAAARLGHHQRPWAHPVQSGPGKLQRNFLVKLFISRQKRNTVKPGSSCRFISVLIPFRLLQKEHCKILRKIM